MAPPRPLRLPRDRQRGNSLLLALIVLSALATLGSLTVVSVQSSLKTTSYDRSQAIARYAAESGAAVAMDFLRSHFDAQAGWSAYVTPSNASVVPVSPAEIPSNGALPGDPGNLFSPDQGAWFDIQLFNNRDDPGFAGAPGANDKDGRLIIRTTGHGPRGSVAILEWEILRAGAPGRPIDPARPVPARPVPARPVPARPVPARPVPARPVPSLPYAFTPPPGMVLLGWHIVSL